MRFISRRGDDDPDSERASRNQTPPRGARFDFDQMPAAAIASTASAPSAFAAGEMSAELMALVNFGAMTSHNSDAGLPICHGPVVIHEDGVTECYGCSDPMARVHLPGSSWSCRPDQTFGVGHLCPRCSPDQPAESLSGRRIFRVSRDGYDTVVSEEFLAHFGDAGVESIVEVVDPPSIDDALAIAVDRLQRRFVGMWGPMPDAPGSWKCTIMLPADFDRPIAAKVMGDSGGARVEAWAAIDIPRSARREVMLFCVAANRSFAKWNLYLAPAADVESDPSVAVDRVVSTALALSWDADVTIEAPMIEAAFSTALTAAFLSAPAIERILNGASALEAVEFADEYGDSIVDER